MYKLMLTDLDETLLDNKGEIPEVNKRAIRKAIEEGFKVAICSGRSYMSLEKFILKLGLNVKGCLGICYNGGMIYEADTNKPIREHRLNRECALEIIKECRSFKGDIIVYIGNKLITERYTDNVRSYCERSVLTPIIVESFEEYINEDVSKILLIGSNDALIKVSEHFEGLEIYNRLMMFFSSDILLEFNEKNVDKGTALEEIAELLNITTNEIIAVGDTYNDISMVQKAGLGVAVANGKEAIKREADYITQRTNSEGAVAEVLERFVFNS